jgi:hypothetical protein
MVHCPGTSVLSLDLSIALTSLVKYDGHTTIHEPPNIAAFDIQNRRTSLQSRADAPERPVVADTAIVAPTTPTPSFGTTQGTIGEFNNLLTTVGALFGRPIHMPLPASPQVVTPTKMSRRSETPTEDAAPASSPPASPSDLPRFLSYAESKGIEHAKTYEISLANRKITPNIIPLIDQPTLEAFGMQTGEVISLKRRARDWWAKEKKNKSARILGTSGAGAGVPQEQVEEGIRIRYRHSYPGEDGGVYVYIEGPLMEGEQGQHDKDTEYYDEARQMWCSIPFGWTAPAHDGSNID